MSNWFYQSRWIRRGPADMRVSHHAVDRYKLRVSSDVDDVRFSILEMWRTSYTATQADLACVRVHYKEGDVYRVGCGPDGRRFVMIAHEQSIVTILEME